MDPTLFDHLPQYLWALLLAVLLLPAAAGLAAARAGKAARYLAVYASALHLILTAALVVLVSGYSGTLSRVANLPSLTFEPKAVPGDPLMTSSAQTSSHATGWNLLTLPALEEPVITGGVFEPVRVTAGPADAGKSAAALLAGRLLTPPPLTGGSRLTVNGVPAADPGAPLKAGDVVEYTLLAAGGKPTPAAAQFFVGLDGLNLPLVALTSVLFLFAVVLSWDTVTDRPGGYYAWLLLLESAVLGAFVSFDILLFYVFFELTLIPAFFLIGRWGGGGGHRDAARKFVLYTLAGSLLTLVGLVGTVLHNPIPVSRATGGVVYYDPDHKSLQPAAPDAAYRLPADGPVTFSIPILMKNARLWDVAHQRAVEQNEARAARGLPAAAGDLQQAKAAQDRRRAVQAVLFFLLAAGFLVKLPVVPFHTWLPAAYTAAPIPVVMVFTGVLSKLGAFGLLRLCIPILPDAALAYGLPVVGTLGAVGIVYAAFCAAGQRDLRLIAGYSSISHLGLLVLGLFALNREGYAGAVLHMVNHGLTAAALFALIGCVQRRYGTTDLNQLGGLWNRFPRFAAVFLVVSLAAVGVPGLNNFVSEMLLLAALFDPAAVRTAGGYGLAAAALSGLFLSAWYTFSMVRRLLFGPPVEPAAGGAAAPPADLHGRELWPTAGLAGLCLALGLFPRPVLDSVYTDAIRLARLTDDARSRVDPAGYELRQGLLTAAENRWADAWRANAPPAAPAGGPADPGRVRPGMGRQGPPADAGPNRRPGLPE